MVSRMQEEPDFVGAGIPDPIKGKAASLNRIKAKLMRVPRSTTGIHELWRLWETHCDALYCSRNGTRRESKRFAAYK